MLPTFLRCASALIALSFSAVVLAEPPALIPRAQLFGNPVQVGAQISLDGKWLAWLAPKDGVLNVWIAPADKPDQGQVLTQAKDRPIYEYFWAPDSSSILYVNDNAGDENYVLYKVAVSGEHAGVARRLTPAEKTQVQIVGINQNVKDRILIGLNNRDPRHFDVYSLDLASGKLTEVFYNRLGYSNFLTDGDLRLRIVTGENSQGSTELYWVHGDSVDNRAFASVPFSDFSTTRPLGFSRDGNTLYWLDSRGRDTAAFVAQDLPSGARKVLGEDAHADVSDVQIDLATGLPEGYATEYQKTQWTALSPAFKDDLAFLGGKLDAPFRVTSKSADNQRWLVVAESPTQPGTSYLYDRSGPSLKELFVSNPALAKAPLARMYPRNIVTRDGLTQVAYLSLPPGSDKKVSGIPDRPLPLVLLVHGGPWARDSYGFRAEHQWLANRGYAVLSVNFRGSTGFGKRFLSAANQQWGAKMQDDLLDATEWAIRNGVAGKDRIAIMGGSYGGYATLVGLTQTPERFACGVDIVGPSNLLTLLENLPPYWAGNTREFYQRIGDPTTEAGQLLLRERSPLFKADAIRRPLLIGQGANDPRVKQSESDQIVQAMAAKHIPVTYVVFPDEGHSFSRPENNIAFSSVTEAFLGECLGGRVEPFENVLKTSTITVPHGEAFVPGLQAALKGE